MKTLNFKDYRSSLNENLIESSQNLLWVEKPIYIQILDLHLPTSDYLTDDNLTIHNFITRDGKLSRNAPQPFKQKYNQIIKEFQYKNIPLDFPTKPEEFHQMPDSCEFFEVGVYLDEPRFRDMFDPFAENIIDEGISIDNLSIAIKVGAILNKKLKRIEFVGKIFYNLDVYGGQEMRSFDSPENLISEWGTTELSFYEDNNEYDFEVDELHEVESDMINTTIKIRNYLISIVENILNDN